MCSTCTTAFDAITWNSAIGIAFASEGARRLRDHLRGRRYEDRVMDDWMANAEFARSVGLDPLEVLGAPPSVPDDPVAPAEKPRTVA